jgi:putative membrane protein insertion efficiency factor
MTKLLIACIRCYQGFWSSWRPPVCRFYPTCSHYAIQALERYGLRRGLWMALIRLLKCHPFHRGGYDPVA